MTQTLDEIAIDYERAELTALWIHSRNTRRHQLLFAVAELCPVEQPASPPIESLLNGKIHAMKRTPLDAERTLYATRLKFDAPIDAVFFFRGTGGRQIRIPEPRKPSEAVILAEPILLESPEPLAPEPPTEWPVLVAQHQTSLLAALPSRHTQTRVLSLFDLRGGVDRWLAPADLKRVHEFAVEHLGVDLERYPEHLGAIHLCFCNPILRSFEERLSNDEKELLFEAHVRRGKTIDGCVLELVDQRPGGAGFHVRHVLADRTAIIPLPAPPQQLRTVLYQPGPDGNCLADDAGAFIRKFVLNVGVSGNTKRRVHYQKPDGSVETHEIDVLGENRKSQAGKSPESPAQMLREEERRRELKALREDGMFYYFPGGEVSREDAKTVLREKLRRVRERCLIFDTYLSGQDVLDFVPFIATSPLNVCLMGSAYFLRTARSDAPPPGETLKNAIDNLLRQDKTLQITCRVLLGNKKSPIHDRFLVLDNDVYLPGSSLTEFGQRATTLFRAPDPESLRKELEERWDQKSLPLDEWLAMGSTA